MQPADSLCAFIAPASPSSLLLFPSYEAPMTLVCSRRGGGACVRFPACSGGEWARRLAFRPPGPRCALFLAFSALFLAGLVGVLGGVGPPEPVARVLSVLFFAALPALFFVVGSLAAALVALVGDHAFLLKGDVFTQDVIDMWLSYKREREVDAMRLRPHPYEFSLYYDV
jgi:Glutamine synthetase